MWLKLRIIFYTVALMLLMLLGVYFSTQYILTTQFTALKKAYLYEKINIVENVLQNEIDKFNKSVHQYSQKQTSFDSKELSIFDEIPEIQWVITGDSNQSFQINGNPKISTNLTKDWKDCIDHLIQDYDKSPLLSRGGYFIHKEQIYLIYEERINSPNQEKLETSLYIKPFDIYSGGLISKSLTENYHLSFIPIPTPDKATYSIYQDLLSSKSSTQFVFSTQTVHGYFLLNDVSGSPMLLGRLDMDRALYINTQVKLRNIILLISVGSLFVSIVFIGLIWKLLITRIGVLKDEILKIGTQDDLTARVSVQGEDELTQLSMAVNHTLERLNDSHVELMAREEYLSAITEVNDLLSKYPLSKELYTRILEPLGKIAKADQVFYFDIMTGGDKTIHATPIGSWTSEGISNIESDPQVQDLRIEHWLGPMFVHLEYGQIVHGHTTEMPEPFQTFLKKYDNKTILLLPMMLEGKWIGFLAFNHIRQEKNWKAKEITTLITAAQVLTLAINRKVQEEKHFHLYEIMQKDMKIASEVQSYLIPSDLQVFSDLMVCSKYSPSSQIGGDLYDVIKVGLHDYFVCMGDVSGHGVQSALQMSAVKAMISSIVKSSRGSIAPYEIANRLNELLLPVLSSHSYLTIIMGYLNTVKGEFHYINAGHPPLLLYKTKNHQPEYHRAEGSIPIGWMPMMNYSLSDESLVQLESGDILILYTDGFLEAEDEHGEQLGITGIKSILAEKLHPSDCLLLPHHFFQYLIQNNYQVNKDDFSLLTLQMYDYEKRTLTLVVPPTVMDPADSNHMSQQLSQIRIQINNQVQEWTGDSHYASRAELATHEYLMNIIRHGYKDQKKRDAIIQLKERNGLISLKIIDSGIKWEPDISPGSPYSVSDSMSLEGRGLKIIQDLILDYQYKRYEPYNEVIMVMNPNAKINR